MQYHEYNDWYLLKDKTSAICIDVRSENEYKQGHIPNAKNLPLLNNEQRHEVGLTYKKKGKEAAILQGFELIGPLFKEKIELVYKSTHQKNVMIYCWRGGLRSNIMAWLLSTIGFDVNVLEGGYKSYRNSVLNNFHLPYNFLVLGGKTGTGKTELLRNLEQNNEQVLNLEDIASHKGSVFGGLDMPPQSTQEQFENNLNEILQKYKNKVIWTESESLRIGKLVLPVKLYETICKSPYINIEVPYKKRVERILNEYGKIENTLLLSATSNLSKRMGPQQCKEAMIALQNDDKVKWVEILLDYYDKTYTHKRNENNITPYCDLKIDDGNYTKPFSNLIAIKESIQWQ